MGKKNTEKETERITEKENTEKETKRIVEKETEKNEEAVIHDLEENIHNISKTIAKLDAEINSKLKGVPVITEQPNSKVSELQNKLWYLNYECYLKAKKSILLIGEIENQKNKIPNVINIIKDMFQYRMELIKKKQLLLENEIMVEELHVALLEMNKNVQVGSYIFVVNSGRNGSRCGIVTKLEPTDDGSNPIIMARLIELDGYKGFHVGAEMSKFYCSEFVIISKEQYEEYLAKFTKKVGLLEEKRVNLKKLERDIEDMTNELYNILPF